MAEPSARDRQRLEALQQRLAASREEKRAWTAERKELRARAIAGDRVAKRFDQVDEARARLESEIEGERALRTDAERSLAQLDQRLGTLDTRQGELVAENRRQAEQLHAVVTENESLRQLAAQSATDRTKALEEAKAAVGVRRELERRVKLLETEHARNDEALKNARAQLVAKEFPLILSADEISGLIDQLISRIGRNLQGLDVRDGELKLKVAFAAAGDVRGFVVPSAGASENVTGPLHEVALRFQQTATDLSGD